MKQLSITKYLSKSLTVIKEYLSRIEYIFLIQSSFIFKYNL